MKTGSRESNQKCQNSIRAFLKTSKSNAKRRKSLKKELNTSCMEPTRFCAWSTTFVIFLFIFLCQVSRECFWLTVTTVDRRGGAKADRKKEIAIATSIENFFYAHISRAAAPKFKMSPAHLVAFIDFVFPSFFKIIVNVFRNESLFSANNSVFHPSSRIPFCWKSSMTILNIYYWKNFKLSYLQLTSFQLSTLCSKNTFKIISLYSIFLFNNLLIATV